MMGLIQSGIAYLGRVLLGVVFLFSAMIETLDWGATEQYYTMVFTRWMQVYQGDESAGWFMAHILPCLPTILIVGVIFRLLGSLLLIVNWQVRFASLLLLIFLFAETYVLYDFCMYKVQSRRQLC